MVKGDALYASRAHHHRIERQRCTRCDGSLPSPLHLAIKRNGFQMMFPPAACSRASRAEAVNRKILKLEVKSLVDSISTVGFWHAIMPKPHNTVSRHAYNMR